MTTDTITDTTPTGVRPEGEFEAGYTPTEEAQHDPDGEGAATPGEKPATEMVLAAPSNGKVGKAKPIKEPKAYKPAEAKAMDSEMRKSAGMDRVRLAIFAKRKGYTALGFDSMADYVEKSEWLDVGARTVERWIAAVITTAEGMDKSIADLEAMVTAGETLPLLPPKVAETIAQLPSQTLRQEAVLKLQGDGETTHGIMGAGKTVTVAQNKDAKNIVSQIVRREHIELPKKEKPPVAEKPAPPTVTKPVPIQLTAEQFLDGEEAVNTLLTFVQNQQVLCDDKDCRVILATVEEMMQWVESHL